MKWVRNFSHIPFLLYVLTAINYMDIMCFIDKNLTELKELKFPKLKAERFFKGEIIKKPSFKR